MAAVCPHLEVDPLELVAVTAEVALRVTGHREHVRRYLTDVVRIITDDPGQSGLTNLGELRWREDSWILIPESE